MPAFGESCPPARTCRPQRLLVAARLDRPSGNITGAVNLEASLGGKWLGLLSEIAPGLKRACSILTPPPIDFYALP
jgi:hypothetical protein